MTDHKKSNHQSGSQGHRDEKNKESKGNGGQQKDDPKGKDQKDDSKDMKKMGSSDQKHTMPEKGKHARSEEENESWTEPEPGTHQMDDDPESTKKKIPHMKH